MDYQNIHKQQCADDGNERWPTPTWNRDVGEI
jgi:hypothetical protein